MAGIVILRALGAERQRFDMPEKGDEEGREEAEEAEDDDQGMPELVWGTPKQRPWWYSDNVATNV